jgi:hypothetical protein
LGTAQIIAFLHVYINNLALYKKLTVMAAAGYLTVPNQHVMPLLKMIQPAFLGGLFFTLTIGSGLTLLTLALVWIWKYIGRQNRLPLILILGLSAACLLWINRHGFTLIPSLYFILIPGVVAYLARQLSPKRLHKDTWITAVFHLVAVVLLAAVWGTQMNDQLFVRIRDHILLSNPVGIKVNDFYYKYTLYPSECLGTLNRKMIKICFVPEMDDTALKKRLQTALLNLDCLPVATAQASDLRLSIEDRRLTFIGPRDSKTETSLEDFFSAPRQQLKKISQQDDRYAGFRQATALSLLIAFPILLYFLLHTLLYGLLRAFLSPKRASLLGTLLCFVLGVALAMTIHVAQDKDMTTDQINVKLSSQKWQDQAAGLKAVSDKQIDILDFSQVDHLMQSPAILVRYRLAKSLGDSKHGLAYKRLLILMNDPHPNVVCQALESIGRKKSKPTETRIMEILKTSDHWYVQGYAYNAMRKLGWKQELSD